MRIASADSSVICFYRSEVKAASCEDPCVCVVHILVALVEAFSIFIKRICVFHDEFTASHKTESRSSLVPVFSLDLVQVLRKLLV